MNDFLQFYLQKYFNLFSFKKSDLYKLLKNYITLFAKEFLIKKLIFGTIFGHLLLNKEILGQLLLKTIFQILLKTIFFFFFFINAFF